MPETDFEREFPTHTDLRTYVYDKIKFFLPNREQNGPPPTPEELRAGTFKQAVEPQCRSIFTMRDRGWNTVTSGFSNPNEWDQQYLMGFFQLDHTTTNKLIEEGYRVGYDESKKVTVIEFEGKPSIKDLKEKWDRLADLMPNLRRPADPSPIPNAVAFRKKFGAKTTS